MPIFLPTDGPTSLIRSVLDTEDISIPVRLQLAGSYVNPTTYALSWAFMANPANQNPGVSDWQTGTWASTSSGAYLAQINVGPAGHPVTAGTWNVWLRVTTPTEVPILIAAILELV